MLLIFDLDGTLIDSSQDLAISMNATRENFGLAPLDPKLIYSFVGNGAATLVRRAFGPDSSEELIAEGLSFFLKYYRAHALEHTRLYAGVREAVESLRSAGNTLAILTNKPARISIDIVAALGIASLFMRVYGGDSFPAKKPDPIGILQLVQEASASVSETMMIGDSSVDVQTARNAAVRSCGVAWGFQPASFVLHPPDILIHRPAELIDLQLVLSKTVHQPKGHKDQAPES